MKKTNKVHKFFERDAINEYVWTMLTFCGIRTKGYNGSYYWKKVTCKNCLKQIPSHNKPVSTGGEDEA